MTKSNEETVVFEHENGKLKNIKKTENIKDFGFWEDYLKKRRVRQMIKLKRNNDFIIVQ